MIAATSINTHSMKRKLRSNRNIAQRTICVFVNRRVVSRLPEKMRRIRINVPYGQNMLD